MAGLVVVAGLALPMVAPQAAQAVPPGTYAYVTNFNANTVSVINTATDTVVATVPVGLEPLGVAVSPNGTRAYVTNRADDTVSVINTATDTVVPPALQPSGGSAFGLYGRRGLRDAPRRPGTPQGFRERSGSHRPMMGVRPSTRS
ncbi:YncE family protein [Streptomyces sp. NPDC059618]|uniref:YncE family protein n=1 Tax=Streptomyces sp. NPDC059618 TaxID=3346887 RepID=UPI00369A20CB